MRLVDIDVEIDRVCNEVCGCDRDHCQWNAYGEGEGCNQIQELEEGLKVVEAIPIEWLQSQIKNDPNDIESVYDDICLGELIEEWQNEQEGNDNDCSRNGDAKCVLNLSIE